MYNKVVLLTNNNINDPILHSQLLNLYRKSTNISEITLLVKNRHGKKIPGVCITNTESKIYFLKYFFLLIKLLTGINDKTTFVHIRGFVSGVLFYFSRSIAKSKCNYIYDPRGAFIKEREEVKSFLRYFSIILSIIEKKVISQSLFTIVETENLKNYFIEKYKNDTRYLLCYNSSSFHVFEPIKKFPLKESVEVCYLGSVNYWHPIEEIIRVFSYLSEILSMYQINFHFYTSRIQHDKVIDCCEAAGISNIHVNFLEYNDVENVLRNMDICVSVTKPTESIRLSSSIKIADYIVLGKRIVCTKGLGDFDQHFERERSVIVYEYGTKLTFKLEDLVDLNLNGNLILRDKLSNSYNFSLIEVKLGVDRQFSSTHETQKLM